MKKAKSILIGLIILVLFYFAARIIRTLSVIDEVSELTTDHFVVVFKGIHREEGQAIADSLERNYQRIRTDLNDPAHERVRVFVHPTQADFNEGTGLINSTANGTSRGPNEFHLLWTNWFNSVFPNDPIATAIHEFTHCVQLNILIEQAKADWDNNDNSGFEKAFEQKFINDYPQWFWEALCDYEAGIVNNFSVKYAMRNKPTLKTLNNSNQIYNVGYTIIDYIVSTWGTGKLPRLIRSYVDIETELGMSESDFEKGWIEFVNDKY